MSCKSIIKTSRNQNFNLEKNVCNFLNYIWNETIGKLEDLFIFHSNDDDDAKFFNFIEKVK